MSEESLGSGPALDESLDLSVGTTGDLRITSGSEELQKDLAFQMIFSLSDFLGEPPTSEIEADVKRVVYRVAIADVRISAVDRGNIAVEFVDGMKELEVEVPVTTITDEQYDLVFNV